MFSRNPATPASHQRSEVFQEGKGDLVQKSPFLGSGAWGGGRGPTAETSEGQAAVLEKWRSRTRPVPHPLGRHPRPQTQPLGELERSEVRQRFPQLANGVKGDIQLLRENGAKILFPAHLSCGMRFSPTGSVLSTRRFSSRARGGGGELEHPCFPSLRGASELFP